MKVQTLTDDIGTKRGLTDANDEMLVALAKSGENPAFVELWNRHSRKIFKTVLRVTRNQEDAEDALQDSFLKAFGHLNSFDGRSKFSTWMTRIAINSALMILRRRRAYPETSMEACIEGEIRRYWEMEDRTIDIEGHYVRSERAGRLKRAILRLRPALRDVVEIQQLHDISVKETAKIAGLSMAATKSRLMRARAALRRSLLVAVHLPNARQRHGRIKDDGALVDRGNIEGRYLSLAMF